MRRSAARCTLAEHQQQARLQVEGALDAQVQFLFDAGGVGTVAPPVRIERLNFDPGVAVVQQ